MLHPTKHLQMIPLSPLLQQLHRQIPVLRLKRMIRLRAAEKQRSLHLPEMLLRDERRVRERPRRAEWGLPVRPWGEGLKDVWRAEAVAGAGVFGSQAAELRLYRGDPLGDVGLGDGLVFREPLFEGLGRVGPFAVRAVEVHGVAVEVVEAKSEVSSFSEGVHDEEAVLCSFIG